MPDQLATTMPALSATSDMPVLDISQPQEVEAAEVVDNPPEQTEPLETSEQDGEGTDAREEQSGEGDDLPAGVKAALSRAKNREKAAQAEVAKLREDLSKALDAIPKPKAEEAPPAEPRPQREAFTDPDAYDDALIEWSAKQADKKAREAVKAETQADAAKRRADELADGWLKRRNAFAEDHPDYEEVAEAEDVQITRAMGVALASMDDGPAVAYHLGKNPEVAEKIAAMNEVAQVVELGKLAASLNAPVREAKPKPKPITPVGARSSSVSKDPSEMSAEEYEAYRLPQLRDQRRARVL